MPSRPPDAQAPPATSLSSQCCRPPTPTPALSPPWSSHLLQMARPPHGGLRLTAFFIGKIWGENCVGLIRGPAGPGLAACRLPKWPARWLAGQHSFPPSGMSVCPASARCLAKSCSQCSASAGSGAAGTGLGPPWTAVWLPGQPPPPSLFPLLTEALTVPVPGMEASVPGMDLSPWPGMSRARPPPQRRRCVLPRQAGPRQCRSGRPPSQ